MYPSWAQLGHNSTRRLPDHLVRRCEWGHTSRSWLFLLMACLSASPSCDRRRIKSTFTAQVPGHTRLFSGSQRQLGSTRSEHQPTHYRPLGAEGTSRLVVGGGHWIQRLGGVRSTGVLPESERHDSSLAA